MGEVRKLQKKLRQIENLEIKISLAPEERFKVQIYLLLLMSARLLARIDAQYIPPPGSHHISSHDVTGKRWRSQPYAVPLFRLTTDTHRYTHQPMRWGLLLL